MKKKIYICLLAITAFAALSFTTGNRTGPYRSWYQQGLDSLRIREKKLLELISTSDLRQASQLESIREQIALSRVYMKRMDFWLRYLDALSYKKINSPLPVEWETEVFEKFEKPYKREGAGLTLASLYLDEPEPDKDSLLKLIGAMQPATEAFAADSLTEQLASHHHFFLCNRLYLLNLAAIYTTGFECPDTSAIIPELRDMLRHTMVMYLAYNTEFRPTTLSDEYMRLFASSIEFVNAQPSQYSLFDHFSFIRDYVNPLFILNQRMVLEYQVVSRNLLDYSLNKKASSIFDKELYHGQNTKGVFLRVQNDSVLAEIGKLGKLLFYDPLLSGNNERSCAGCHKPQQYFTDTTAGSALHFNRKVPLSRTTPSLINAQYNHLLMFDGRHISLEHQAAGVVNNPSEMGSDEEDALKKIMSCREYKDAFTSLLAYTPQEKKVTFAHIASAISIYYSRFSSYYSPFDEAMMKRETIDASERQGFNLFMSRAQCATCHFVPQFNGVKPPYIGSEFEVLGTPGDSNYTILSNDKGRYEVNPAKETLHAFRTGTLRNASRTAPYMHNGVFRNIEQLIDFYDGGGGAGRGLQVPNQTLSSDSLHLSQEDKKQLLDFISTLDERIVFDAAADHLPSSRTRAFNNRKPGGTY